VDCLVLASAGALTISAVVARSGANLQNLAQSWKNFPRGYHKLHVEGR
jgi:hypothetical protein